MQTTQTAVLDLRDRSVARGQNPSDAGQAPLETPRTAKHLVLDLPIGNKKGPYEVALIPDTGGEHLRAMGTAELRDHVNRLRIDVDLSSIRSGNYSLGIREPGFEWLDIPSVCFGLYVPHMVRNFGLQNFFLPSAFWVVTSQRLRSPNYCAR